MADEPQKVEVTNASACKGEASDGTGRFFALIVIAFFLFVGFDALIEEAQIQNEILAAAHNIDLGEIRARHKADD